MKPKTPYKSRMSSTDAVWLIWSNKWGCWYRANSSGYTSDIAQAGLYDRVTALQHYDGWPSKRENRDTEPFPISAVRKELLAENSAMLERHRLEVKAMVDKLEALDQATRKTVTGIE